jgi:hypothetical protein
MTETIRFRGVGIAPLVMANPAARNLVVDDDRAHYVASLHLDQDRRPCIPADLVDAMLVHSTKARFPWGLSGPAKDAMWCVGEPRFHYEGPSSPEELWKEGRFRHVVQVKRAGRRVKLYLPVFETWWLDFEVEFVPLLIRPEEVIDVVDGAQRVSGIGWSTPLYGRLRVVELERYRECRENLTYEGLWWGRPVELE